MSTETHNQFPKLHNATWPGLVGKGGPDAEPVIEFEKMLDMTAAAEVNGQKFDGVDIFLSLPHTDIDSTDDQLKELADQVASRNLVIGSLVAPVWGPTGGGSAMGSDEERAAFLTQIRKSCEVAQKLNNLGIRHYGVIRIDSSCSPGDWSADPAGNTKKIADTFHEACNIAEGYGRKSNKEFTRFLNIAVGSLFEYQTQIEIAKNINYIRSEEFDYLYNKTRELEAMMSSLIKKTNS